MTVGREYRSEFAPWFLAVFGATARGARTASIRITSHVSGGRSASSFHALEQAVEAIARHRNLVEHADIEFILQPDALVLEPEVAAVRQPPLGCAKPIRQDDCERMIEAAGEAD